ncbi:hypothetical protein MUK42_14306, partial [Musa troglodytarum]
MLSSSSKLSCNKAKDHIGTRLQDKSLLRKLQFNISCDLKLKLFRGGKRIQRWCRSYDGYHLSFPRLVELILRPEHIEKESLLLVAEQQQQLVTMNGFGDRPKMWSDNTTPSGANDKEAAFKDLSSSMNALSFGFIATAILVSMFLVMAIFEHLLRSRASHPPSQTDAHGNLEMRQEQDQMPPKMIKNWQN